MTFSKMMPTVASYNRISEFKPRRKESEVVENLNKDIGKVVCCFQNVGQQERPDGF